MPASFILWIPSTYTSSPTANGCGSGNPLNGVSKKQVTIPPILVCTEFIPTPLELSIATIWCWTESKPWIGAITSTLDIVWFGVIASNVESSIIFWLMGLNNNKLGGEV